MLFSFASNCVIVLIVAFAAFWMIRGSAGSDLVNAKGIKALRFFTTDSNLLMGIVSLISAGYGFKILSEGEGSFPIWLSVLNLISVTSVMLTFTVVIFYLVPATGKFLWMYSGSNFAFHFFVPVLAALKYVLFEHEVLPPFVAVFLCLIPPAVYGIFYAAHILRRRAAGLEITKEHDWYGFFRGGVPGVVLVFSLNLAATFGLASLIWYCANSLA